jgi:hypothetical protein
MGAVQSASTLSLVGNVHAHEMSWSPLQVSLGDNRGEDECTTVLSSRLGKQHRTLLLQSPSRPSVINL